MLISVLKLYFEDEKNSEDGEGTPPIWSFFSNNVENGDSKSTYRELYVSTSGPIFTWKLVGCFIVSGIGTLVNMMIILCHFDTIFFPSFWLRIFRDGSILEAIIVYTMAVIWAGGLHVNTSPLSVGEIQANVYFTTWIAFFTSVVNCGVWRVSAGRKSIAEYINHHHRETTYNWLWTLFFSTITATSICISYANREYIQFYFRGENISVPQSSWIVAMSTLWGLVIVCLVAVILNHFLKKSCEVRVCGDSIVLIGWRQLEGLITLGLAGMCDSL
jgi:hypothetical protein